MGEAGPNVNSPLGGLVTVMVPAYNYARFVTQAIESAWSQSYRPLEIVAVDDGSTDGTYDVLVELAARSPIPMRVLRGEHRGVAAALNLALTEAQGDWVSVLHADDYLDPAKLARQAEAIAHEPRAVLAHCEYVCVDEHGHFTGYDSSTDLAPARGDALRDLLMLRCDVRSMTMFMKRSALMDAGGYDEFLPVEDWQSILRLAKRGRIVHVDDKLVYRRVHGANISSTAHRLRPFSFHDIARNVLEEVTPPEMSVERICAIHTGVVVRHSLALGAWRRGFDGLRALWLAYPEERARGVADAARGIASYGWVRHVRGRLSPSLLSRVLALKAALTKRTWQSAPAR